jgi:diaminopimelate decarboxylase
MSMSSTYNSRPKVAEVMVHGRSHALVARRGTYDELVSNEAIPGFIK